MANKIFTLDARGNIMFETMQGYFGITESQMRHLLSQTFSETVVMLKSKGIEYSQLKGALVPAIDRQEAAFVFDTSRIESNWYGLDVFKHLLPCLDPNAIASFLCGDMIELGGSDHQDILYAAFSGQVQFVRSCEWMHSSQFYIVYINNLTEQMRLNICETLAPYEGYVGWVNCFVPSPLKMYFSMVLAHSFVKAGRVIIQGHEDDRDIADNVNMLGYPFERFGYKCKSIPGTHFGPFLGYKIERGVFPGFESDTLLSLNSISARVVPLDECEVDIEEAKLDYLRSKKQGSMKRAGLLDLSREALQAKLKERLMENYIFNMEYLEEHEVLKFNTILNFCAEDTGKFSKMLASLEYRPSKKRVRLITLF